MKEIFKLASRNIWRNKRRTIITSASILFAVFFAIAISSIQEGTWDHMVNSVVHYHVGYVQVHKQGYWEDKTIDNAFDPSKVYEAAESSSRINQLVPRIESFALASFKTYTKGTIVIGIDPERERRLTKADERIVDGQYLHSADEGVLVAEGLAEYLKVGVNDTVVLISQGYHGINAAGKFPIRGLIKFGSPELNKQLVYLDLQKAKWFYGTGELLTALVLDVKDPDNLKSLVKTLRTDLGDDFEVMDYREMMPDLIQAREVDTAGSQIILMILYLIIGFGIFGTILMMLKEREYEFGILKAIGMRTSQLNAMLWMETIFLGMIGCIAGVIVSLPLVYYFYTHPIELSGKMAEAYERFGVQALLPASTDISIFINQAVIILFMITVLSIYPMFKIAKLKPVKAMRG